MALPALARLAAAHPLTVAAPPWGAALYRGLGLQVVPREQAAAASRGAKVAVLLKPSFSAAWQTRHASRRFGEPTDHRRWLLTDPVRPTATHRADRLLAVACAALQIEPEHPALPSYAPATNDGAGLPEDLPAGFVLVLPGTASGPTVRWRGFAELVTALDDRALITGGPGDQDIITKIAEAGGRALVPMSLPDLAALARKASAVVGNDSGLTHFAAAAVRGSGGDVARVFVVYASTDPTRTGPPGSTPWHGPRPDCWPCYAKSCHIGGAPCTDASARPLLDTLRKRSRSERSSR